MSVILLYYINALMAEQHIDAEMKKMSYIWLYYGQYMDFFWFLSFKNYLLLKAQTKKITDKFTFLFS